MVSFYQKQHKFYSLYHLGKTLYEKNGFDEYPMAEYSTFVKAINLLSSKSLRIIDIGCGNGLLLKHIIQHSDKQITPYGIDFLNESISEAKFSVCPDFSSNFICINAKNYSFTGGYDLVLYDPSILKANDASMLFRRIKKSRSHYCILYSYSDVIKNRNITSVTYLLPTIDINNFMYNVESEYISLVMTDLRL